MPCFQPTVGSFLCPPAQERTRHSLRQDINPTVAEHISENVKQLEMQISQTAEATSHVSESTTSSAKTFFAPLLDRLAEIKVDSDTEDEYWVFGSLPFIGPVRILRKETSTVNVILCGLFAGFLVEFTNALTLHPLDTLKTRLQRGSLNQGQGLSVCRITHMILDMIPSCFGPFEMQKV